MSEDDAKRRQAGNAPPNTEEWFEHLIQNSPDIITVVDANGTILYQSSSIERILGHKPGERIGKNALDSELVHPEDRTVKNNLFTKAIHSPGTSVSTEVRMRHQDGSWRYMHETIRSLLEDPNVGAIVLNDHDITERKQAEEQLRYQALHDSLTDLPNRTLLLDRLEHALSRTHREGGPVAVLLVDLDDFKLINDSMGHAPGNTLLVEVARRLQGCVRFGDTVARLFGDEFVILLEAPVTLWNYPGSTDTFTLRRASFSHSTLLKGHRALVAERGVYPRPVIEAYPNTRRSPSLQPLGWETATGSPAPL